MVGTVQELEAFKMLNNEKGPFCIESARSLLSERSTSQTFGLYFSQTTKQAIMNTDSGDFAI
ncbi:hypothetical protein N183_35060 [Sinorhizobium sp. Sb3]|nr:hypothetical protein N183_35060 [Sinorhizobium sp. Sb3]